MCANREIVKKVVDLVNEFPNDMALGEAVRKLIIIDPNLSKNETTQGKCNCVCGKEQTK